MSRWWIYVGLSSLVTFAAVLGWSEKEVLSVQSLHEDYPSPDESTMQDFMQSHKALLHDALHVFEGKEKQVVSADNDNDEPVKAIQFFSPNLKPSLHEIRIMPKDDTVIAEVEDNDENAGRSDDKLTAFVANLPENAQLVFVTPSSGKIHYSAGKDNALAPERIEAMKASEDVERQTWVFSNGKMHCVLWTCVDKNRDRCLVAVYPDMMPPNEASDVFYASPEAFLASKHLPDGLDFKSVSSVLSKDPDAVIVAQLPDGKKQNIKRIAKYGDLSVFGIAKISGQAQTMPAIMLNRAYGEPKFLILAFLCALLMAVLGFFFKPGSAEESDKESDKDQMNDVHPRQHIDADVTPIAILNQNARECLVVPKDALEDRKDDVVTDEIKIAKNETKFEEDDVSGKEENKSETKTQNDARSDVKSALPSSERLEKHSTALPVFESKEEKDTAEVSSKDIEDSVMLNKSYDEAQAESIQLLNDAFSDEGWEDIVNSFDNILLSGDSVDASESDKSLPALELPKSGPFAKPSSSKELSSAFSRETSKELSVVGGLKPPKIDKLVSKDKISKDVPITKPEIPAVPQKISKLPPVPKPGTLNNSLRRKEQSQELPASVVGELPLPKPSDNLPRPGKIASHVAVQNKASESGGFKPAPSWTGIIAHENVNQDDSRLRESLQQRAKGASVELKKEDLKNSRLHASQSSSVSSMPRTLSLSNSGVFSVTGSRVNIDPTNDMEYFKSLYGVFIDTKKQCGEPVDSITLDKFISRLAKNKEALLKQYQCKTVKFQVYVKDGKASLKATPIQ